MEIINKNADVLIIGGGAAGLFSAIRLSELNPQIKVIIAEKADIRRSGCLAAGVNALNAYIGEGHTPKDYADYAINDAHGIARYDLLLSMAERLNHVTEKVEKLGLIILKDENGKYQTRGWRNVKINGENIKIILEKAVKKKKNVEIINHVNIVDFHVEGDKINGAYGFSTQKSKIYNISAKKTLITTGGASGIYLPKNAGFSRHQIWYSPFNTGAGYAMGIRAGAEMTTFEMRFIALRIKDTVAATGTLAQGVGAAQINAFGEKYQEKYGNTTSERVYAVNAENLAGRGPCYLKTTGISKEAENELIKAYFNMSPAQSLKWLEREEMPSKKDVEIIGSEPYIIGGHTASGYWIDEKRQTTLKNLYAAGDVAGGCPQKYVTGAFAEAEIAAESIAESLKDAENIKNAEIDVEEFKKYFRNESKFTHEELEIAMQTVMDEYAGGINQKYRFNEKQLKIAKKEIERLEKLTENLRACEMYDLLKIYELRERLTVAKVLIEHLKARRETRWAGFYENMDYPKRDEKFKKFVNSKLIGGKIEIIYRKI